MMYTKFSVSNYLWLRSYTEKANINFNYLISSLSWLIPNHNAVIIGVDMNIQKSK